MTPDGFLRGHRVSRALAVAVPLAIFLVWWSIWGGRGEVVAVEEVEGVIVEKSGKTCLVRAAQGETTRLLCPTNLNPGVTVRLNRMRYDNGELRFAFAQDADSGATR